MMITHQRCIFCQSRLNIIQVAPTQKNIGPTPSSCAALRKLQLLPHSPPLPPHSLPWPDQKRGRNAPKTHLFCAAMAAFAWASAMRDRSSCELLTSANFCGCWKCPCWESFSCWTDPPQHLPHMAPMDSQTSSTHPGFSQNRPRLLKNPKTLTEHQFSDPGSLAPRSPQRSRAILQLQSPYLFPLNHTSEIPIKGIHSKLPRVDWHKATLPFCEAVVHSLLSACEAEREEERVGRRRSCVPERAPSWNVPIPRTRSSRQDTCTPRDRSYAGSGGRFAAGLVFFIRGALFTEVHLILMQRVHPDLLRTAPQQNISYVSSIVVCPPRLVDSQLFTSIKWIVESILLQSKIFIAWIRDSIQYHPGVHPKDGPPLMRMNGWKGVRWAAMLAYLESSRNELQVDEKSLFQNSYKSLIIRLNNYVITQQLIGSIQQKKQLLMIMAVPPHQLITSSNGHPLGPAGGCYRVHKNLCVITSRKEAYLRYCGARLGSYNKSLRFKMVGTQGPIQTTNVACTIASCEDIL